jgi:hypothetical protein
MLVILVFSPLRFLFLLQPLGKCTQLPGNIFAAGCLNVTEQFVKDHAAIIGGAGIGVACLMVSNNQTCRIHFSLSMAFVKPGPLQEKGIQK